MTDTAVLLRRRSRVKWKKRKGERDVKIDGRVSGLFNKATLWSQLQTSNTATSTTVHPDIEPTDDPVYAFGREKVREQRERERVLFRILQGPTMPVLLLHLLYIIWQTSSNTERRDAQRKRIHTGKDEERMIRRKTQSERGERRRKECNRTKDVSVAVTRTLQFISEE